MKFLISIVLAILFILFFVVAISDDTQLSSYEESRKDVIVHINNVSIRAEEVVSFMDKVRGLGGREELGSYNGMFFNYDGTSILSFWMKDMRIPIDIIWIRDGRVIDISTNLPVPASGTPDSELPRYSPQEPVQYALEVNAGFVEQNRISVGDPVEIVR